MVICPDCISGLRRASGPGRCAFCAAEWEGDDNCPRCFHLHELAGIRAAFEMTGTARNLVHALKYRNYRAIAPAMGAFMAPMVDDLEIDSFFAVPLHKSRKKGRGFNQAELLMKHAGWAARAGSFANPEDRPTGGPTPRRTPLERCRCVPLLRASARWQDGLPRGRRCYHGRDRP